MITPPVWNPISSPPLPNTIVLIELLCPKDPKPVFALGYVNPRRQWIWEAGDKIDRKIFQLLRWQPYPNPELA